MEEITNIDLIAYRGDDETFTFNVVEDNKEETPIDFSNYRLDLHIKPEKGSVLQLSTTTGGIVVNGNEISVILSSDLTKNLKWENAEYDLQSIKTINNVHITRTILRGQFTLIKDITLINEN